jgi:hypothetical protein
MYACNALCNFGNIIFIHTVPVKETYLLTLLNTEHTEILSTLECV